MKTQKKKKKQDTILHGSIIVRDTDMDDKSLLAKTFTRHDDDQNFWPKLQTEAKALTGQALFSADEQIEKLLKSYWAGEDISDFDFAPLFRIWVSEVEPTSYYGHMFERFPGKYLEAILCAIIFTNDFSRLRRLADAIARVHKRASGSGSAFQIKPANPELLATLKHAHSSGTLPTSASEIQAAVSADKEGPLSARQTSRISRKAGVTLGKPGPKTKPKTKDPKPKLREVSLAELKRDVAKSILRKKSP